MTRGVEFSGVVTGGRLPAKVAEQLATVIRLAEGKRVVVAVREQKRTRSNQQNAYLWGAVYPPIVAMFRDAGNMVDAEDVHLFLKLRVGKLSQVFVTPDGEVIKSLGSTAKLTTTEFMDYVERVREWAAGFDVIIPLPDEAGQEHEVNINNNQGRKDQ